MKNFIQDGKQITVTAPKDVTSGELVAVGNLVGVAVRDQVKDGQVALSTEGVYNFPVKGGAVDLGDIVNFDSGNVTKKTTGSPPLVGVVTKGGTSEAEVKLK